MDPLGNQPAQTNPQQPPMAPPPSPAPTPVAQGPVATEPQMEAPRPEQMTPPVAPQERPVEAWPPAGTAAAQEISEVNNTPAAEAPVGAPATAQPAPTGAMDGFVAPVPIVEDSKGPTGSNPVDKPMSDQQADSLFQEEPETKEKKPGGKAKKTLIILFTALILSLIALGGYILYFGNKAAQAYVGNSASAKYKEAFSQISSALEQSPIKSAELESVFNKLKAAKDTPSGLSQVVLGNLNPNYKKAQDAQKLEEAYIKDAKAYYETYGLYPGFVAAIPQGLTVLNNISKLPQTDLTTTTAEILQKNIYSIANDCSETIKAISDSEKPSDLSDAAKAFSDSLTALCTNSIASTSDGAELLLKDQTGILSSESQAKLGAYYTSYKTAAEETIKQTNTDGTALNKLLLYKTSALEQAKALAQ